MNNRTIMAGFLILIILFAFSCARRETSYLAMIELGQKESKEGLEAKPVPQEAWKMDWEKTLQVARKEGKVVVYALSSGPTLRELGPQFKRKFGFDLEVNALDVGPALLARILSERKAGLFIADIYSGGLNPFFPVMKPAGLADPIEPMLILPEVVDPKNWFDGELPWSDKEHLLFRYYSFPNNTIAMNTDLVKPKEIHSYYDLLNPKWKGKIIMNDPTIAGVGSQSFSALAFHILNLDFFRQLVRQEPMIIRDQRLQVEWLAKNKYHLLLFPRPAPMMEFLRAGAPIAYVPTPVEGTYLASGSALALLNRAPHPNAAKIFINWFLSREGQIGMIPEGMQSTRLDVPTDGLDPSLVRQPGVKYFDGANTEEYTLKRPEYEKIAKEIFGDLVR